MEKISRTKIVDLMKREDFGAMVNVKGWVRTRRGSKQVNFIALRCVEETETGIPGTEDLLCNGRPYQEN